MKLILHEKDSPERTKIEKSFEQKAEHTGNHNYTAATCFPLPMENTATNSVLRWNRGQKEYTWEEAMNLTLDPLEKMMEMQKNFAYSVDKSAESTKDTPGKKTGFIGGGQLDSLKHMLQYSYFKSLCHNAVGQILEKKEELSRMGEVQKEILKLKVDPNTRSISETDDKSHFDLKTIQSEVNQSLGGELQVVRRFEVLHENLEKVTTLLDEENIKYNTEDPKNTMKPIVDQRGEVVTIVEGNSGHPKGYTLDVDYTSVTQEQMEKIEQCINPRQTSQELNPLENLGAAAATGDSLESQPPTQQKAIEKGPKGPVLP